MITIGADPELFVSSSLNGFISAHNLLPGTKQHPHPVTHGAIQVDGTAAEFNIHPASTRDEFVSNITSVIEELRQTVVTSQKRHNILGELSLVCIPTVVYDPVYFKLLPQTSKILGCDPDYNAWGDEENPKPRETLPIRTGGGHIHVGWRNDGDIDDNHINTCAFITKQLDSMLFALSPLWDSDNLRRKTYGKMGNFRPKKYGVEYRSLSNAWVADPSLMEWIFDTTTAADELLLKGKSFFTSEEFNEVLDNIDDLDVIKAYHEFLTSEGVPSLPTEYLK